MTRVLLPALALLVLLSAARAQLRPADAPHPNNDTRCGQECVRCAADGCVKCARLLVWPEGKCVHGCPSGTREAWAHDDHLMGRICYPAHSYNEVLVGGACGAVACIALVAAGAAYARCRNNTRAQAQPVPQRPRDDDAKLREFHKQLDCLRVSYSSSGAPGCYNFAQTWAQLVPQRPRDDDAKLREFHKQLDCLRVSYSSSGAPGCYNFAQTWAQLVPQRPRDDDAKLREFHKQLDCLRPHAYTLLAILNHTRHQVRELYQLGNNDAAMAYSCVLSDLAKLLILLNKQQVPVVPEEWPRLASWAERILKRYSRMGVNGQQEGQLVNFLPNPPSQSSDSDTPQSFSTFKPPSYSPTSYDSNNVDKEIESWSDVRPPSYSQIERETIVLSDPWERRPIVRRESVWLEDELFEMTRRPQDELTTEL
ncbi:hypothetical protein O0L34_g4979 [Tuta absoluta]|nr:hypothetical protein O0L34_g4979 [Tuta absoluta]